MFFSNTILNSKQKIDRLTFNAFITWKAIYQILGKEAEQKIIVFIVGCQRSGTTLMTDIFQRDIRSQVFGEFSQLSSLDPRKIRLNPLPSVENVIDQIKAPLIVLKPLVETQNIIGLMDHFKNSKTLWMYRYYKDVAISNIRKFGIKNGIMDLKPIAMNESKNWRNERASKETRQIVLDYFSDDMNPHDAASLFWFVRNKLFFDLNLQKRIDVLPVKYENLAFRPSDVTKGIYRFLSIDYPGNKVTRKVHSSSINKGKSIQLRPEIEKLCEDLYAKLETASHKAKNRKVRHSGDGNKNPFFE
jgi:hypothetical protein